MKCTYIGIWLSCLLVGCTPLQEPSLNDYRESLTQIDKGVLKLREGELEEAKAAFKVSLELNPSAAAYDGLGCVAIMEKRYSDAETLLWKAYNMDRQYDHVLGNLAFLYEAKGEIQTAKRFYLEAIDKNPSQFRFRNNFAAYLWDHESYGNSSRGALEQLRKARSLSDDELIQQNIVRLEEVEGYE